LLCRFIYYIYETGNKVNLVYLQYYFHNTVELCGLRKNIFLKRYTSPPIKALNRIINKIRIEKTKAISLGIPISTSINIRVFSLNPIPPIDTGIFAIALEIGRIKRK
jgi:hypothetical protein